MTLKDNILQAKATENQQQAEIIQKLEVPFMDACMYVTALCNNVTLHQYPLPTPSFRGKRVIIIHMFKLRGKWTGILYPELDGIT